MANFPGGFAFIDFDGKVISTTPITVPGAYALVKTGKPVIFGNVKFDLGIPPATLCVSMSSWDSGDADSDYVAIFGDNYVSITHEDSVFIQE